MAKVMISLPDDLLEELDDAAKHRSMSRSAFLAAAARRELTRRDPRVVDEAIRRSEERFASASSFDAGDLVRRDRDRRR